MPNMYRMKQIYTVHSYIYTAISKVTIITFSPIYTSVTKRRNASVIINLPTVVIVIVIIVRFAEGTILIPKCHA